MSKLITRVDVLTKLLFCSVVMAGLLWGGFAAAQTNTAPVANTDRYTLDKDTPYGSIFGVNVLDNDTDADGDTLQATPIPWRIGSNGGTFIVEANGNFFLDPDGAFDDMTVDETIVTSITYTISDGTTSSEGVIEVEVTGTLPSTGEPTPEPEPEPEPEPTLTFSATATTITAGESTALEWSAVHATDCEAGGAWSGTQDTSGSVTVSPNSNATYELTCTGAGGSITDSVEVTVMSTPEPEPEPEPTPTDTLNVRTTAGLTGQVLGQQPVAATGVVDGVPAEQVDGYVWRSVTFAAGVSGWVAEQYLVLDTAGEPTPPVTGNTPPVANTDRYTLDENTLYNTIFNVNVLDNDTDADGDTLSTTAIPWVIGSNGGTFILQTNGDFLFDHDDAFSGLAVGEVVVTTASYTLSDGTDSVTGTVEVEVIGGF